MLQKSSVTLLFSVDRKIRTTLNRRMFEQEKNEEVLNWIRERQSSEVITEIEKAVYLNDGKRLQDALREFSCR